MTFVKAEEPLAGLGPEDNWKELALDGLEIHTVPGNHFTTIREPHVRALAQTLSRCMAQEFSPNNLRSANWFATLKGGDPHPAVSRMLSTVS